MTYSDDLGDNPNRIVHNKLSSEVILGNPHIPNLDDWDKSWFYGFSTLEQIFCGAQWPSSDVFMEWLASIDGKLPEDFAPAIELFHPLSNIFDDRAMKGQIRVRAWSERNAVKGMIGSTIIGRTEEEFVGNLCYLHSLLCKAPHHLRWVNVQTLPDRAGDIVKYPPIEAVQPTLSRLWMFLDKHSKQYPAISASVAYCTIVHIHPFQDGNGRTARVIFNLILDQTSKNDRYFPIYEASVFSKGGHTIAHRDASYFGNWNTFGNYLAKAAAYLIRVMQ